MNTTTHATGNGRGNGNGSGPGHPIGVVSRRTGLSIHVLRAWERRYGVVKPGRTPGRQRLYTDADVTRLRLLRQATETGRTIGQVAKLSTPELIALLGESEADGEGGEAEERDESTATIDACVAAAEVLDDGRLHSLLQRAVVRMRPQAFVTEVAGPLLRRVGELWHEGEWTPAQEHLVSVTVRRALQFMLSSYASEPDAPLLVTTTLAGEQHELGAMLAGVVAADEGWRVLFLGPDLPASDIARVAATRRAAAVAVSLVNVDGNGARADTVRALKSAMPGEITLIVGGRGVTEFVERTVHAIGGSAVGDFDSLRRTLRALAGATNGRIASAR